MLAQTPKPVLGRDRRRQRLDADQEVLALDSVHVGVTLCGQRVDAVGEHVQGRVLASVSADEANGFDMFP
jgi:hypothetical protein